MLTVYFSEMFLPFKKVFFARSPELLADRTLSYSALCPNSMFLKL